MATSEDYRDQLLKLLPFGKAWAYEPSSWAYKFAWAMGEELARVDGRARDILREIDPRFRSEMITDFETELGMPDACTTLSSSIADRRADVIAHLVSIGGQSEKYFVDLFANAGVNVTFSYIQPSRAGVLRAGDRVYGKEYKFIFYVNIPNPVITLFTVGLSTTGQPLSVASTNTNVPCLINKNKPAHTHAVFTYS